MFGGVLMLLKDMSLGEAELEIMKVLWNQREPVNTQIINKEVVHKNWKRTTISTLLSRLVLKGAISSEKRSNSYYYTPLISAKEYRKTQFQKMIKSLYNNSIRDFAVSLFEDEKLSTDDIRELKLAFDDVEK